MIDNLHAEAHAFDRQIIERIANGHVPDLRRTQKTEYFYCNSWRDPTFVELDFGKILERVTSAIGEFTPRVRVANVLEVGCGPGHMTLELARNGYDVTGIDVSAKCIEVAEEMSCADPWKADRGPLSYLVGDFFTHRRLAGRQFNAIIFLGALHHFADQDAVARRVTDLLKADGIVIAHEPTRDRCTEGVAEFIHLVRVLLAAGGGFYEDIPIPETDLTRQQAVTKLFRKLRYETDDGEAKCQSPHDNDAGFREMDAMLNRNFARLRQEDTYAFYHEMIGGLRFDDKKNATLARYLRSVDESLIRHGVLPATEFFFVGRRR